MDWNQRFVVLDIETTGLNYEYWDEPTEIAAIEIINKKITGNKKHFYLKPYKKINEDFLNKVFGKKLIKQYKEKSFDLLVTKNEKELEKNPKNKEQLLLKEEINKVKEESSNMLKNINNGKNKRYVLPELREFIGDSIIIGHNVTFDINFLNFWNNELGINLYTNYICTFKNFKKYYNFKENNLEACCNYYNINLENAHNALDDTLATAQLFLKELEIFNPEITQVQEYEAYTNFKKRVIKTSYCTFMRAIMNDKSEKPKNIENLSPIEIDYCENLFYKFKKPLDVSKITGLDLNSVEDIFLNWVNCININKHLDLIKDKYLINTIKEILKYSNNNPLILEKINNELFQNINYFFYNLVNKLENKKDSMNYDLNDFDFYFKNLKNLKELSKKIGKNEEFIYTFLFKWINHDNKRFLLYKNYIKNNYKNNPINEQEIALKKALNSADNKDYILKQLSII